MRKCLLAFALIYPFVVFPQGIDTLWKSLKDNNYTNGKTVYAIVTQGSDLIVGGSFTSFGRVAGDDNSQIKKLAKWNGTEWIQEYIGTIPPTTGAVYATIKMSNGDVIVGGDFSTTATDHLLKTNGTLGMGEKPNAPVYALASKGSLLYVGGMFTSIDIFPNTTGIALYNDNTKIWSSLGTGITGGYVKAIAIGDNNDVYVGGKFFTAGGVAVSNIAKWDGANWSKMGVSDFKETVTSLAFKNGVLYAGTEGTQLINGTVINHIAKYNSGLNQWEPVGGGVSGSIPNRKYVTCLAFWGNDLLVGGYFDTAGTIANTKGLARWDGSAWHAVDAGIQYNEWGSYPAVHAIHVSDNGEVYIGGLFTSAGNTEDTRHIAKLGSPKLEGVNNDLYDEYCLHASGNDVFIGSRYQAPNGEEFNFLHKYNINSGLKWIENDFNNDVYAIHKDNNNLYVGGNFDKKFRRWDGTSWQTMNAAPEQPVRAIATKGSEVYIGGDFIKCDMLSVYHIGRWTGSAWTAMDNGVNDTVRSIVIYKNNVVAGGGFDYAGASLPNTKGVVQWNGTAWQTLGNGVNGTVNSLAASDSLLFVGGSFTMAGATMCRNIAWWNGTVWGQPMSYIDGEVKSLAYKNNYLYVASVKSDTFKVQRLYVKSVLPAWELLMKGNIADVVLQLAVTDSAVYVCGRDLQKINMNSGIKNIARYNLYPESTGWHSVSPKGNDGYVNSIAVGDRKLFIGGSFTTNNGLPMKNAAKWNTYFWEPLGNPQELTGEVASVCTNGNETYYAGNFTNSTGAKNVAKWNGLQWDNLSGGLQYPSSVIAVNGKYAYAGIPFYYSGILPDFKSIFVWDGSVWTPMPGADMVPHNIYELDDDILSINAIAFQGNKIFAAGRFAGVGTTLAGSQNIAMYDGVKWNALMNGIDGTVYALAVVDSILYVGGNFKNIDGLANTKYLAMWNGSKWSAVGNGVDAPVYSLNVIGKNVYVGGNITSVGGKPANNIAVWNSSSWETLGSGVNGKVKSLSNDGSRLFVGGDFTIAGQTETSQLAIWDGIMPYVVSQSNDTSVMLGNSVSLTASVLGSQPISYQWYKNNIVIAGVTSNTLVFDTMKYSNVGEYYVKATNAVGTVNSAKIQIKPVLPSPQICMVTVDTALKCNKIIWEKNEDFPVLKYKIFQEIGKDLYVPIGEKLYSELSVFNDTFADPNKQSYSYKITAVDSTGKYESKIDECISHRTMHVVIVDKQGSSGTYLQWSAYDGFSFPSYTIYRNTGSKFDSLSTTAAGYFYNSFLDNYFAASTTCYFVKVNSPAVCAPTGTFKAESGPYTQSLSNIAEFKTTSRISSANEITVTVYPNPFSENLTIEFALENNSDVLIEVINAAGQKTAEFSYKNLAAGTQQIQLSATAMNITEGMCYIKLVANEKTSVIKCNFVK